jgi:polyisoprenyl-phosphate glycosyltransferase
LPKPHLTVVTPVYNEEAGIIHFLEQLRESLDALAEPYEVIAVDDGSRDQTHNLLTSFDWKELRVITLPVNLGHQAALDAGLRASKGEWVLTMDSDGQHPPEAIGEFLTTAKEQNVSVVYGVRGQRKEDSLAKRLTAKLYYKLMRTLTDVDIKDSAADFRLLRRDVVDMICSLPPGAKVFRLLIPSLSLPSSSLEFSANQREFGSSKYTLKKMIALLVSSTVSFSTKPLWISIQLGLLFGLLAILGLVYTLYTFFTGQTVQGWASTSFLMLSMFSINFLVLGVIGLYIGELAESTRARINAASFMGPKDK